MSVYKMTNKQMIKFVILYRDHECLWKTDSPFYKNRDSRDFAYKRISDEMAIEGFRPSHVAQKIKNLRTTYHQELRKIALSQKYGTSPAHLYKPRAVWFEIVDDFLREQIQSKAGTSCYNEIHLPQTLNDAPKDRTNSFVEDYPSHSGNTIKHEWQPTSSKLRNEEPITESNSFKSMDGEVETTEVPESSFPEYEFFGSYVDATLKQLPFEQSLSVQRKIVQMLSTVEENEFHELESEESLQNIAHNSKVDEGPPTQIPCERHNKKSTPYFPVVSSAVNLETAKKCDDYATYGEHVGNKLRHCGRTLIEIAVAQYNIDKVLFNLTMGSYSRTASIRSQNTFQTSFHSVCTNNENIHITSLHSSPSTSPNPVSHLQNKD